MVKPPVARLKSPPKIQTAPAKGLYRKAALYIKKAVNANTNKTVTGTQVKAAGNLLEGIGEDEKREIINEIDTLIAQKKRKITPELFIYKPEQLGFFLPLLINLLAAGIVLTAFLLLPSLFEKGFFERSQKSEHALLSTESDIVEKYKQESAAKISEKEAELSSIQGKMSQLQKEKELLDTNFNEQVRKKEAELKKSLQHTLEQEKQKLISQGITREHLDEELNKLESQLKQTNTKSLDSYKNQMQTELSQKEKLITELGTQLASGQQNLAKIQAQYQNEIKSKESALKAREEELKKREAALQANYNSEKQQLESALDDVSGQYSRFKEIQEQEALVHNQILAYYNALDLGLKAQDYNKAAEQLKSLETLLNKKELADLTLIRERKQVELFLIGAFKEYINFKQSEGKKKKDDTANPLEAVVTTVKAAQQAYNLNDKQQAYKLYAAALEKIPEIRTSFDALQKEREELHKVELDKLAGQLAELKKKQTELEAQALNMTNELSALKSKSAAISTAEEQRRQLAVRLGDMKQQFLDYLEKHQVRKTTPPADEYTLIQAKISLKKVLSSEAVISQYPELNEDLENYFNRLNEERMDWQTATESFMTVLAYLSGEVTISAFKPLWPAYRQESRQKLFRGYLSGLQAIFTGMEKIYVKKLDELTTSFNSNLKNQKPAPVLTQTDLDNLGLIKQAVKKILAAAPYATRYPGLYQNLEKYLGLLEEKRSNWQTCFQELAYLTSRLQAGFTPAELNSHWPVFQAQEYKELLLKFINTLQALF